MRPLVERIFEFSALWRIHQSVIHPPYTPEAISERMLENLNVEWVVDPRSRETLAELEGPVVVASNHPCGGIEFFALVRLLEAVRPITFSTMDASIFIFSVVTPLQTHSEH